MTSTSQEERWRVVYLIDEEGTRVLRKIFTEKLFWYFLKKNETDISNHLVRSDIIKVFPKNCSSPKLENLEKSILKSILSSAIDAHFPDDNDENLMRSALIAHLKHSTLKTYLDGNEKNLKDKCRKNKILNENQLLKLYPSHAADLEDFDITILSFLLFESSSMKPPRRGFKSIPKPNNTTESDDILRIRLYRNDLVHKDAHTDFAAIFNDVKYAIIRLGGKEFQERIDKFEKEQKFDKGLREKYENVLALWSREEQNLDDKIETALALLKILQAYVWRFLAVLVAVVVAFLAVVTYFIIKNPSESLVASKKAQSVYDHVTLNQPSPVDECTALGGHCQIDSYKCAGSYVSNKCPGYKNIRCCMYRYNTTDTGFCTEFGVTIVGRDSWGARRPKAINYIKTPVNVFLIHHTVTPPCTTTSACIKIVKSIQNFHMDEEKWDDIGYSFLVGEDGKVYEGRGWNREGAHTRGQNKISVAAAMIGDYRHRIPSEAALKAVKKLIECGVSKGMLSSSYGLFGHRDFRNTISPGDALYNDMKTWPNFHRHYF